MPVTTTPLSNPVGANLVVDTDADATGENDTLTGTSTVSLVDIDNTANSATSYLKLYDAAAPTIGTTAPDFVLPAPARVRTVYLITAGHAFATAVSFACVTTAGTAGTTSPTSDVTARLIGN